MCRTLEADVVIAGKASYIERAPWPPEDCLRLYSVVSAARFALGGLQGLHVEYEPRSSKFVALLSPTVIDFRKVSRTVSTLEILGTWNNCGEVLVRYYCVIGSEGSGRVGHTYYGWSK